MSKPKRIARGIGWAMMILGGILIAFGLIYVSIQSGNEAPGI
jgi:hypothetical protein